VFQGTSSSVSGAHTLSPKLVSAIRCAAIRIALDRAHLSEPAQAVKPVDLRHLIRCILRYTKARGDENRPTR
jgi:hypothetical protein